MARLHTPKRIAAALAVIVSMLAAGLYYAGAQQMEEGKRDRVVTSGLLRVIPGQKVDPQVQKIAPSSASSR